MDSFLGAYVDCALWDTCDDNDVPLDKNYSLDDISEKCLKQMKEDCEAFQVDNATLLLIYEIRTGRNMAFAGHDFWLTRERHSTRFWDRGDGAYLHRLTDASHAYGEFSLYVGDDGKIHH